MTDTRFTYQRAGWTETECDCCHETIMESEDRFAQDDGDIWCEICQSLKRGYSVRRRSDEMVVGVAHYSTPQGGWIFIPHTTAHQRSRKAWCSASSCVPVWVGKFDLQVAAS